MRQFPFRLTITTLGFSLLIKMGVSAVAMAQIPSADLLAQPNLPENLPPPQDVLPPPSPPPQPQTPEKPSSPDELLPTPPTPNLPQQPTPTVPVSLFVNEFQFEGSSVFKKDETLLRAMEVFLYEEGSQALDEKSKCERFKKLDKNPPPRKLPRSQNDPAVELTFTQLLEARSAITQLYICKGYITSGALIPAEQTLPPPPQAGPVKIQIVEGVLEDIQIVGNRRLKKSYIRNRLARASKKPLNRNQLLEALQLLQLNPRIANVSAELASGTRFGTNLLIVRVDEARTFHGQFALDNNRSPSVGTFQRSAQLREENLLGIGDTISLSYANTDGSNEINFGYVLPLTASDTTLAFSYGKSWNNVIEPPFDILDISSESDDYQLTLRHPLFQNPRQELAVGLTLSHQQTQTSIGLDDIGPFPLSPGADDEGRTRISALRFFQEWTQRGDRSVFALRSQFSFGLDILDATQNEFGPDSSFFAWRGQAQLVRLLGRDSLLVIRGDVQVADRNLVSLEQFRLGGQASVRGYRQDLLLSDNGAFGSVELRLPILRDRRSQSLLQIIPFVDIGTAWNNSDISDLDDDFLVSAGVGLRYQLGESLDARFDWGIPLVSVDSDDRTLQENGLYFSLVWNPF